MSFKICQFTSAATKGDVYVSVGFKPDFIIAFLDITGTNPNQIYWGNPANITLWPAQVIKNTGSSGILTIDADAGDFFTAYDGGEIVPSTNAATLDGKHVDSEGALLTAGQYSRQGVLVVDDFQTNSGINILLCFANDGN